MTRRLAARTRIGNGVRPASKPGTALGLPGTITPTGYLIPPGLAFEEWLAIEGRLQDIRSAIKWALGDWLCYGERYGERYAQAVDDRQAAVWMQYAYVAGRFEISRRLEIVDWSVHQALAGVRDESQRYDLLQRAAAEQWTVKQARGYVRSLKDPVAPVELEKGRSVTVGELVLTLFAETGLLMIRRHDRQSGVMLNISTFSDEAKALVLDFLNEGSR